MLSVLNQRSNSHNSCEDSVFVRELGDDIWGVIADGCSTGIKSHFASELLCYIVAEISKWDFVLSDSNLFVYKARLLKMANLLGLSEMNLLCTCILFQYNKNDEKLLIRSLGDCYYYLTDKNTEYIVDQNNTPDYIGYHIYEDGYDFQQYLSKYPIKEYSNINRFMICSDGIKAIERSVLAVEPKYDSTKLLFDIPSSINYLTRMWNKLKSDHYTLRDDLTIISYA